MSNKVPTFGTYSFIRSVPPLLHSQEPTVPRSTGSNYIHANNFETHSEHCNFCQYLLPLPSNLNKIKSVFARIYITKLEHSRRQVIRCSSVVPFCSIKHICKPLFSSNCHCARNHAILHFTIFYNPIGLHIP